MKGVLIKDLYIAKSNILVTLVSLVVLGFGLSFLFRNNLVRKIKQKNKKQPKIYSM